MATTFFKLIGPTAFRSFRCVWMLEELGIPYEHVTAFPASKCAKKFHPMGKIPALVVNEDWILYESAAINTYLADFAQKFIPEPRTRERAHYDQIVLFLMTEMDASGLWIHSKHERLAQNLGGPCPDAVAEAKRQFERAQHAMEREFVGPYVLGGDFTAADILYVHCLDWATNIEWFSTPSEGRLSGYLPLCTSRPAYQRTIAKRTAEEQARKLKQEAKQSSNL